VVRPLPRAARTRSAALLLTGSLLLACASTPFAAADQGGSGGTGDLKAKKHKVEKRLKGAHADLDDSSAQLRNATAALLSARSQLSSAQSHLAQTRGQLAAATSLDTEMQGRLVDARARLRRARTDLDTGRRKIADEQRTLGQIVVQNYQSGDPSLMGLSMVLTTQDPTELTGQLNSVQNVMDKESVVLDHLEAARALLVTQEHEVAQAKVQVAGQRRAAAANLVRKQGLESEAESAASSVQQLVTARADAHQAAETAKQADLAQLANLQSERDRIAKVLKKRADEARARAAAAAAAAGSAGPVLGDGGPAHSDGFLDYPVVAPVTSPFGWRIHPIYGYRSLHDGVDFGAACGTPIRATAAGTVVEKYFQTAWGNRVIIDHGIHHGVGLATISNHMVTPAIVDPGQHVRRGQIVGYVGTTGWSTGCHLHFTVLQNGTAVDPMSWF
jgi:murein DD-endopeptidase MepM/ murein hydrolase activator NlpD